LEKAEAHLVSKFIVLSTLPSQANGLLTFHTSQKAFVALLAV
jgi:hypothetical protein